MNVKITAPGPMNSFSHWWYADRLGETFEVKPDPNFPYYYRTVEPVWKEHQGHIRCEDCEVIVS